MATSNEPPPWRRICFACEESMRGTGTKIVDKSNRYFDPTQFPVTDDITECTMNKCLGRAMNLKSDSAFQEALWAYRHTECEADMAALRTARILCDKCKHLVECLHSLLESMGKSQRARTLAFRLRRIQCANRADDCQLLSCVVRGLQEERSLPLPMKALRTSPICEPCYQHFQASAENPFKDIEKKYIRITENANVCVNFECVGRPRGTGWHNCTTCTPCAKGDPNICDCTDSGFKEDHVQILACIQQIESLHNRLKVSYGVTQELLPQYYSDRRVDPAVPWQSMRTDLEEMSKMLNELTLGEEKIETQPGRPLCPVPEDRDFHCHTAKISAYPPANCDCTPTACACTNCILIHVRHCVKDYEEAVARVAEGITKLREMERPSSSTPEPPPAQQATTGGCAMPGIRNAKSLKGYTKAQKEAYNKKQ